ITSVLTLSTFGLDTRTDLPKVSYPTALDWFVIMCFSFVMFTILEFAGVHYFTKIGSGEVPLIEIDEDWAEDRLEDNEDALHIITPPKGFLGSDSKETKYFTATPVNKLRLRPSQASKQNYTNNTGNNNTFVAANYCPKHDRYFSPELSEFGAINALGEMNEEFALPESDSDFEDEYEDYESVEENEDECKVESNDYLATVCNALHSTMNCCYQFYNCFIGSEEYRNRMRSRRSRGRGFVNSVSTIDKVSRILFPLSFALLNLFYWMMYYNERNAPFETWNFEKQKITVPATKLVKNGVL
ncbi:putative GABA-gated ion channel-like protein, partial [Dinothrombium tinctorium]